ncbi:MAG: quinone oxidoreductase [Chloroflexi bacterium]|nr:quinone oxidoreductase [Chloroflexota bacterium]
MKAILVSRHGPPEVLQIRDLPIPEPLPGEVLVHNHFVGVNFVDTQHRAGLYYPIALPLIPGTEASGVVAAVGADVPGFSVGDRVAYAGYMGGNYAEYTCVPHERLVAVPAALPLEQAAAGLLQGLTAYMLTHEAYQLQPGNVALIHAAAGGVGLLLVQMAKHLGATVIGTTSSAQKGLLVSRAGADHVIVHTQTDIEEATIQLTNQQGVSVVYDGVGGSLFEKSLNVLQTRGSLVAFGLAGGQPQPLEFSRLSGLTGTKNRGSLFVTWASLTDYLTTAEHLRTCADAVFGMILGGQLRLHVTGVFPLEQAAQTHDLLETRATSGKLLLQVTEREDQ